MKKMFFLAIAAIMSVASASAATVKNNIDEFSNIKVDIPSRVRVVKGDKYDVFVQSTDKLVSQSIKMNVEDGTLKITTRDLDTLGDNMVRITIITPEDIDLMVASNLEAINIADLDKDKTKENVAMK